MTMPTVTVITTIVQYVNIPLMVHVIDHCHEDRTVVVWYCLYICKSLQILTPFTTSPIMPLHSPVELFRPYLPSATSVSLYSKFTSVANRFNSSGMNPSKSSFFDAPELDFLMTYGFSYKRGKTLPTLQCEPSQA